MLVLSLLLLAVVDSVGISVPQIGSYRLDIGDDFECIRICVTLFRKLFFWDDVSSILIG